MKNIHVVLVSSGKQCKEAQYKYQKLERQTDRRGETVGEKKVRQNESRYIRGSLNKSERESVRD